MYGPFWIILAAAVGATGAILAQIVSQLLSSARERRRFRIESFERFRRELLEDELLRSITSKKEALTDDEIQAYVTFFEHVGLYFNRNLIDADLVDEVFGDYVIESYEDAAIRKWIEGVRAETRDETYFENFDQLARSLLLRKTRRRRR